MTVTPAGKAVVETGVADKTKQGVKRITDRFKNASATIGRLSRKAATAAAAMAAPLILAARKFARTGDQIDKFSKRTGIGTDSAQSFGFAMEQSGSSMEKLEPAIKKFNSLMLDARRGLKSATDEFEDLGEGFESFRGLSAEDSFRKIVKLLSEMEDEQTRNALAVRFLGKSGTEVLPLLGNLEDLEKQFDALGTKMSKEQVEQAAAMTDAFNKIGHQVRAIVVQIGSALGPALTELAESWTPTIKSAIDWIRENKNLVVWLGKLAAAIGGVSLALKAMTLANPITAAIAAAGVLIANLDRISEWLNRPPPKWVRSFEEDLRRLHNYGQEEESNVRQDGNMFDDWIEESFNKPMREALFRQRVENIGSDIQGYIKNMKAAADRLAKERRAENFAEASSNATTAVKSGLSSFGEKLKAGLGVAGRGTQIAALFGQMQNTPAMAQSVQSGFGLQALGLGRTNGPGSPIEESVEVQKRMADALDDVNTNLEILRTDGLEGAST